MFLVSVVQLDVPDKCADFIKVEYHTEMKKNLLSRIHWEMKYVNDNSLDVVFLGYLKKEELLEIIKHTILVFPSYIETVGLPLVEAQIFDQ